MNARRACIPPREGPEFGCTFFSGTNVKTASWLEKDSMQVISQISGIEIFREKFTRGSHEENSM